MRGRRRRWYTTSLRSMMICWSPVQVKPLELQGIGYSTIHGVQFPLHSPPVPQSAPRSQDRRDDDVHRHCAAVHHHLAVGTLGTLQPPGITTRLHLPALFMHLRPRRPRPPPPRSSPPFFSGAESSVSGWFEWSELMCTVCGRLQQRGCA